MIAALITDTVNLLGPKASILNSINLGFDQKYDHVDVFGQDARWVYEVKPQAGRIALAKILLGGKTGFDVKPDSMPPRLLPRPRMIQYGEHYCDHEDARLWHAKLQIEEICGVKRFEEPRPGIGAAVKRGFAQWRASSVIALLGL